MHKHNINIKYFLNALILVFGYFGFILYQDFLFNIIIAIILVFSTFSINELIHDWVNSRITFILLSTLFLAIIFIIPLSFFISNATMYLGTITSDNIVSLITKSKDFIINLMDTNQYLSNYKNDIANMIDSKYIANNLLSFAKLVTAIGVTFIKDIFMILLFYMLILIYFKPLKTYLSSVIPLDERQIAYCSANLSNNMSITFYAIIITAILEGFLFGFLVSYFNYDGLLFGILFAFASLIPIVGATIMWLPLSLYEYFSGDTQTAIIIALYTIIIISIITDTFIKTYIIKLIKTHTNHIDIDKTNFIIHELLLLFSIIAGLAKFGFWGVLIGPAITIVLFSLIDFYKKYKLDFY